jgi:hypothetical protein
LVRVLDPDWLDCFSHSVGVFNNAALANPLAGTINGTDAGGCGAGRRRNLDPAGCYSGQMGGGVIDRGLRAAPTRQFQRRRFVF